MSIVCMSSLHEHSLHEHSLHEHSLHATGQHLLECGDETVKGCGRDAHRSL